MHLVLPAGHWAERFIWMKHESKGFNKVTGTVPSHLDLSSARHVHFSLKFGFLGQQLMSPSMPNDPIPFGYYKVVPPQLSFSPHQTKATVHRPEILLELLTFNVRSQLSCPERRFLWGLSHSALQIFSTRVKQFLAYNLALKASWTNTVFCP